MRWRKTCLAVPYAFFVGKSIKPPPPPCVMRHASCFEKTAAPRQYARFFFPFSLFFASFFFFISFPFSRHQLPHSVSCVALPLSFLFYFHLNTPPFFMAADREMKKIKFVPPFFSFLSVAVNRCHFSPLSALSAWGENGEKNAITAESHTVVRPRFVLDSHHTIDDVLACMQTSTSK